MTTQIHLKFMQLIDLATNASEMTPEIENAIVELGKITFLVPTQTPDRFSSSYIIQDINLAKKHVQTRGALDHFLNELLGYKATKNEAKQLKSIFSYENGGVLSNIQDVKTVIFDLLKLYIVHDKNEAIKEKIIIAIVQYGYVLGDLSQRLSACIDLDIFHQMKEIGTLDDFTKFSKIVYEHSTLVRSAAKGSYFNEIPLMDPHFSIELNKTVFKKRNKLNDGSDESYIKKQIESYLFCTFNIALREKIEKQRLNYNSSASSLSDAFTDAQVFISTQLIPRVTSVKKLADLKAPCILILEIAQLVGMFTAIYEIQEKDLAIKSEAIQKSKELITHGDQRDKFTSRIISEVDSSGVRQIRRAKTLDEIIRDLRQTLKSLKGGENDEEIENILEKCLELALGGDDNKQDVKKTLEEGIAAIKNNAKGDTDNIQQGTSNIVIVEQKEESSYNSYQDYTDEEGQQANLQPVVEVKSESMTDERHVEGDIEQEEGEVKELGNSEEEQRDDSQERETEVLTNNDNPQQEQVKLEAPGMKEEPQSLVDDNKVEDSKKINIEVLANNNSQDEKVERISDKKEELSADDDASNRGKPIAGGVGYGVNLSAINSTRLRSTGQRKFPEAPPPVPSINNNNSNNQETSRKEGVVPQNRPPVAPPKPQRQSVVLSSAPPSKPVPPKPGSSEGKSPQIEDITPPSRQAPPPPSDDETSNEQGRGVSLHMGSGHSHFDSPPSLPPSPPRSPTPGGEGDSN